MCNFKRKKEKKKVHESEKVFMLARFIIKQQIYSERIQMRAVKAVQQISEQQKLLAPYSRQNMSSVEAANVKKGQERRKKKKKETN